MKAKRASTINPVITENTECSIVEVHAPVIDSKVGMSLVSLCFVSLPALQKLWVAFQLVGFWVIIYSLEASNLHYLYI